MSKAGDDDIWRSYAKGVKPIAKSGNASGKKVIPGRVTREPGIPSSGRKSHGIPDQTAARFVRNDAAVENALDRRAERMLRSGKAMIEARLDLHGMTQEKAHAALGQFIERQRKSGRRLLLVITGKGRGGEGVLRSRIPDWLAAPAFAPHILALRSAAINHGGEGAFYILLRKQRPTK